MPPVPQITIKDKPPFTEQVEIKCDLRANLFIGPNATGKSTLIRHIGQMRHNSPCIVVPAVRLGLPASHDDEAQGELIRQGNALHDVGAVLQNDFASFDSKRIYFAKQSMKDRLLTRREVDWMADNYFKALSLSYACAQTICGELLPETLPVDYAWRRRFVVNDPTTLPSGAQSSRHREAGTTTHLYDGMGITVKHDITYDRHGTYDKLFAGDLSDGTQGTLAWIEFLALKVAHHYEFAPGWESQPAILLIDEIENHLHPTWQRRVIPTLLDRFENLQIFATTHSPFVVAGLRSGQIHRLFRDGKGVVRADLPNEEAIVGWTIDEILRGLMDVRDPTDEKTALMAQELRELRAQGERDTDEEEKAKLNRMDELSQSVDRSLEAGGIGAVDLALFEEQFRNALTEYRESKEHEIE